MKPFCNSGVHAKSYLLVAEFIGPQKRLSFQLYTYTSYIYILEDFCLPMFLGSYSSAAEGPEKTWKTEQIEQPFLPGQCRASIRAQTSTQTLESYSLVLRPKSRGNHGLYDPCVCVVFWPPHTQ